jgi:caffeoyl-CoA O-methyltransferase
MQLKQATQFDDYNALIDDYMARHSDAEPDFLAAVNRETHLRTINPRMMSGHFQGRILKMLVRMAQPQRILEIGTFTGYSALCMAEGLTATDAHIDTIEIDDELEDFIRQNFAQSPYNEQITLHIGDARKIIPTLAGEFDFVFIDADKREYLDYYELVLPRVRKGGFILADNTLWDGKVLIEPPSGDHQTIAVKQFNDFIASDQRIEKVILPLRDGLTLMRKN